jgi:hypothetical protein
MGFHYGALLMEDLALAILCHSGEGIFFSSRMFDQFSITSGSVNFSPQAKVELIQQTHEPTSLWQSSDSSHMGGHWWRRALRCWRHCYRATG